MNAQVRPTLAVVALASLAGLSACMTGDPNPFYASASPAPSSGGSSSGDPSDAAVVATGGDNALAVRTAGDSITFVDTDLPTAKADRTMEAWVSTTFKGEGYLVSYGTSAVGKGFLLGIEGGKAIVTQIGDSISGSKMIADGRWHHLAVTFTGSSGAYAVYTDGEPDGTKVMSTDTTKGGKAFIGTWLPEKKAAIGLVDEVRVWAVARGAAEIKADMSKRLSGSEPQLVAYFSMDATGRGAGIGVANKSASASVRSGVTEGGSVEFVPGLTFP